MSRWLSVASRIVTKSKRTVQLYIYILLLLDVYLYIKHVCLKTSAAATLWLNKYYAITAAPILPEKNWNHWKTSDFISCLITITPPLNLSLSPWRLLQLCTSFLPIFAILAILATFTTCLCRHAAANQPTHPLQWSSTSVATGATPPSVSLPRAMQRVGVGARNRTAGPRGVDGWSVVGRMVRVDLVLQRFHPIQLHAF